MQTYEVRFVEAPEKEVRTFRAKDVCEALVSVQAGERPQQAELWTGGKKLCELGSAQVGEEEIWLVGQEV